MLLGVLISLVSLLSILFIFFDVGNGERGSIVIPGFNTTLRIFDFLFELDRKFGSNLLLLVVTRIWIMLN